MKNHFIKICICCFVFWGANAFAQNQTAKQIRQSFSNSTVPATLIIEIQKGNIIVEGYKGKEVIIEANVQANILSQTFQKDVDKQPFTLEERHNTMLIRANTDASENIDFKIQVPEKTTLKVKLMQGGNVTASRTSRLVEVDNQNGSVNLNEMQGWAVINTINGNVKADFSEVIANKTMSFIALNGNVYLNLPQETQADFRMKSNTGEVRNEFDKKLVPIQNFAPVESQDQSARAYNFKESEAVLEDKAIEMNKNAAAENNNKKTIEKKATEANKKTNKQRAKADYNAPITYEGKANGGGAVYFISARDGKIEVKRKKR